MHKCKLCYRSFSNGRALGGHMRSHMMNLAKQEEESSRTIQLSFEAESAPSSSSSSSSSEDDGDKNVSYGLRENPKRNIRIVDPEFSGSVILQDRESETESSKNNPTRRRSKRVWKIGRFDDHNYNTQVHDREAAIKKVKFCNKQPSKTESCVDHEPVSSVSDATTEEDVAFCLMMLSRDKWKKQKDQLQSHDDDQYEEEEENDNDEDVEEEEEEEEDHRDESQELVKKQCKNRLRKGRYKCETCNKVFRSYQALGGHRVSHKKIKVNNKRVIESEFESGGVEKKIHVCPVCFRVFASGQALGGHKRTHVNGSATTTVPVFSSTKLGKSFIDLNLPAPIDDDDDVSQIENSAVSDAEFVKTRYSSFKSQLR